MTKVFELFHLSLIERPSLFSEGQSRERWLRQALGQPFEFEHRTKIYHWVPNENASTIIGTVARIHRKTHHKPPEEGAEETVSDEWQGAIVIVDPTHHDDGQKVSFERDYTVGRPRSVLQSLLAAINDDMAAPYLIEPRPIFRQSGFWEWAAAHEYRLQRITFDFVVPNMWGSASELDKDLRELGGEGVQRAKVTFESKDGFSAKSEQVRDGVDYSAKGGGSVTAKAQNKDRFKSTDEAKTTTLPAEPAVAGGIKKAITTWLPRLLGREQDDSMDSPGRGDDSAFDG